MKNFYVESDQVLKMTNESYKRMDGLAPIAAMEALETASVGIFDALLDEGFSPDEILGFILQTSMRHQGPMSDDDF
jgi:hypothetical protein